MRYLVFTLALFGLIGIIAILYARNYAIKNNRAFDEKFTPFSSEQEKQSYLEMLRKDLAFAVAFTMFFGGCGLLADGGKDKENTKPSTQAEQQKESGPSELDLKYQKQEEEAAARRKELEEKASTSPALSPGQESNEAVLAWCDNIQSLINDTDEQWTYWWPIATSSHNPSTNYDAVNTLNINLMQYFDSLQKGHSYDIPNVSSTYTDKMNKINGRLTESLWKRVQATDKYREIMERAMNGKDYSASEGKGIGNRVTQADQYRLEAITLLNELRQSVSQ